ncbi:MAG: PAS domain S-box protein [Ignavibacteria bacterium]|nr:PAS domain S-box protein [Ignavibacteria bacterium]
MSENEINHQNLIQENLDLKEKIRNLELQLNYTNPHLFAKSSVDSEDYFRNVFHSVSDAVFIHDADTGKIIDVNERTLELYGYTYQEIIHSNIGALSLGDSPYSDKEAAEWLSRAKTMGVQSVEWIARKKNGFLFHAEVGIRFANIREQNVLLVTVRDVSERKSIEQKLNESQKKFLRVYETVSEGIIWLDESGIIESHNKAIYEMTDYMTDELIGLHINEFLQLKTASEFENIWRELKEGKNYYSEVQLRAGMDKNIWVLVSLSSLRNDFSEFIGAFCLVVDITNRKKMEDEIFRSRNYLQAVFDSVSDAIFIIDGKTKNILDVNKSACVLFGYNIDELIGKSIHALEKEYHILSNSDSEMLLDRVSENGYHGFQFHSRKKNGDKFWAEIGIRIADIGGELRYVITVRDITERLTQELAIRESEESYRGLFNTVQEAIYIQDMDGRFIDVNEGAVLMYGYDKEVLIGQTPEFVTAPGMNDLVKLAYQLNAAASGVPQQFEFWAKSSTGRIFPKDVRVRRGTYFGKDVLIAIAFDITERKHAELALRESEETHRILLEESTDPIFAIEHDGTYKYVNYAFANPFGLKPNQIIGRKIFDIFEKAEAEKRFAVLQRVFLTGESIVFEVRVPAKEKDLYYLTTVNPVKDNSGHTISVICSSKEITKLKHTEQALRQSREQFEQFMRHLPGYAYLKGNKRELLFINERFRDDFQLVGDTWKGSRVDELVSGPETARSKNDDEYVISSGKPLITEEKVSVHDELRTLYTIKFPIPVTEQENILGIMSIDITERKKWEELIRARADLFQYADRHPVDEVLFVAIAEICRLTDSPIGFLHLVDETEKRLITKWWVQNGKQCIPEPGKFNSILAFNETGHCEYVLYQRKAQILNVGDESSTEAAYPFFTEHAYRRIVLPLIRENKIVAILGVGNKPVDYDKKDVELSNHLADMAWDIVENKLSQKQLEESEKRYRSVIENVQDIFYRVNREGELLLVSPSVTKSLGYILPDDVIGNKLYDLWLSEKDYKQMCSRISMDGAVTDYEVTVIHKDGSLKFYSTSSNYFYSESGTVLGIEGVFRDVSERKRNEKELVQAKIRAEELNQAKTSFLANMSHELRTPLIGIIGYSEILRSEISKPEHKVMIETIFHSGGRLLDTLNLILNLAKIEANKQEIKWQQLDLNDIVVARGKLFESVAVKKQINLLVHTYETALVIYSDKFFLESIINNLVNNAVKFTDQGEISINTGVHYEKDAAWATFSVKDSGIGIPRESLDLIFEEFRQVSEGYGRDFEGSGLGLAITKRSVNLLGGKITVESELGKGSIFRVYLPLTESGNIRLHDSVDRVESPKLSTSLPDILLVDDDDITFGVLQHMLGENAQLDHAVNGYNALEMVKKKQYAMVLLDINLGRGINGITVLRNLREMKNYARVPVIAITAYAMQGDKEAFISAGCDFYLSKPFTRHDLFEIIERSLKIIHSKNTD